MKLQNAILISGASQRVGAHLVRRFLQQGTYPVVFTYRTYKPQVDELVGLGALAIECDFCKPGALQILVEELGTKVQSLRALIHNASLWLDDSEPNSFEQQFQVHVNAPYYLNQTLHGLFSESSSDLKDIISISDAGVAKGHAAQVGYMASKAALQNMAASFAKRYAPHIKVNDIAPALIEFNSWDDEAYKQRRLKESLIPIEPGCEVVWQAVNYLMNSSYTTGTVLKLDGGRALL